MPEFTFVVSRAIRFDDAEYIVSVYRSENEFIAFWECKCCSEQKRLVTQHTDREVAIAQCQRQIEQHHAQCHAVAVHV